MNILYGVPGEGMGHATRSKVIISYLLKNHNVQIVSSGRAYKFLDESFPGKVHEIKGFHLAYKEAAVSKLKTITTTLKEGPKQIAFNLESYLKLNDKFKPDIAISDFESFSYFFARYHRIPIISIDNMQVINRCKLEIKIPGSEKENYLIAKSIVKAKVPGCLHYFISSFFDAPLVKGSTTVVGPIVRNEIRQTITSEKNHVLVYQSSNSKSNLVEILKNISHDTFYVYGFNKDENHGNVKLKSFSEQGFINDLASAKAVIANGGFSFLSEAVYLKKPIYAFPIKNQFEQFVNAAYIEKMGFGRHFDAITADHVKAFLYDLTHFKQNLEGHVLEDKLLFKELDKLLLKTDTLPSL